MKDIVIGNQVWMALDLDVSTFRNGGYIRKVNYDFEWKEAWKFKEPAWCYVKDFKGNKLGKLYNGFAVLDPRGLAPLGYRIPTHDDFLILINELGGIQKALNKLKCNYSWDRLNYFFNDGSNSNGTNESGFKGVPYGYRDYNGEFKCFDFEGHYWSVSEDDAYEELKDKMLYTLKLGSGRYEEDKKLINRFWVSFGLSVRCIKEDESIKISSDEASTVYSCYNCKADNDVPNSWDAFNCYNCKEDNIIDKSTESSNDDEIVEDEIAEDEITDDEIADDELADDEIADDEIEDDELADDEITDDEIADDEITDDEITEDEITEDENKVVELIKENKIDDAIKYYKSTFNISENESSLKVKEIAEKNGLASVYKKHQNKNILIGCAFILIVIFIIIMLLKSC